MYVTNDAAATLAAALNDGRALIGDPRSGGYHVAFTSELIHEADRVGNSLEVLEIIHQANFKRDQSGTPIRAYLAIYKVEQLRRLFDRVEADLDAQVRDRLETLVLAREPIPQDTVDRIVTARTRYRWNPAKIAQELTEKGYIAGMGGGWTERKIKKILQDAVKAKPAPVAPSWGLAEPGRRVHN